ncbi:MAG: DNA cytosine methyltransferase [Patescibacteria group bacterium]
MGETKDKTKPIVVDLFCGAGGLSKGFEQAGFKVLLGIDNIPLFTETFRQNHLNSEVMSGDIRKISVPDIQKKIGRKRVDVVVGGPPCQGFSMAGKRDPSDPRNSLFMEFIRIVDGLAPKYFVMENVRGLLSMTTKNGEMVKDIIQEEFRKIGYYVESNVLLAANYGVPQKRRRIVFIGTKMKKNITFPEPTHSNTPFKTIGGKEIKKWVSVKEVLLPRKEVDASFFHSQAMIDGFRKRKEHNKKAGKGFGWQILRMDEPSFTISARYYKDGGDALVMYDEKTVRMLTPRECARIQGFPDDFEFCGSKRDVYTQIGNAVPPPLARAIAKEILNKL